jgi:hypothetical protein
MWTVLSIWCKSAASLLFSFTGDSFVGVCLEWREIKRRCFIVNVYSKCNISGKRILWEHLVELKNNLGRGAWCILGDFNVVLNRGERIGLNDLGSVPSSIEIVELRDFVADMELVDLPLLGRRFTWYHPNGTTMSRIDRVLVSPDWLDCWANPSL